MYDTVDNADMSKVVNLLKEKIDDSVESTDKSSNLPQRKMMQKFMDSHCRSRQYFFSVKKCLPSGCELCGDVIMPYDEFQKLDHLPDPVPDESGEHYKSFQVFPFCH